MATELHCNGCSNEWKGKGPDERKASARCPECRSRRIDFPGNPGKSRENSETDRTDAEPDGNDRDGNPGSPGSPGITDESDVTMLEPDELRPGGGSDDDDQPDEAGGQTVNFGGMTLEADDLEAADEIDPGHVLAVTSETGDTGTVEPDSGDLYVETDEGNFLVNADQTEAYMIREVVREP